MIHTTHIMGPNTIRACGSDAKACANCMACTCHFPIFLQTPCKNFKEKE